VAVALPIEEGNMASVQQEGNSWYCQFIYRGKRHTFAIGPVGEEEAAAKAVRVDGLLNLLKRQLVGIPTGVAIVEFIRHNGKPPERADRVTLPSPAAMTLGLLRDQYLATHSTSLEERTLDGIRLHFKHLAPALGERVPIRSLKLSDLQGYVERRVKARGHCGRNLSPVTIRKELISLRTAWNWGAKMGHVSGRFPSEDLRYPKHGEKPPFQTSEQIERYLPGVKESEHADLWEALYLTSPKSRRPSPSFGTGRSIRGSI
jgi:hypothetical protein